jgi:hypothetical protein
MRRRIASSSKLAVMPLRRFSRQIIRLCMQKRMGKHSPTTSAHFLHTRLEAVRYPQKVQQNLC